MIETRTGCAFFNDRGGGYDIITWAREAEFMRSTEGPEHHPPLRLERLKKRRRLAQGARAGPERVFGWT
jgi:hypothetical protein